MRVGVARLTNFLVSSNLTQAGGRCTVVGCIQNFAIHESKQISLAKQKGDFCTAFLSPASLCTKNFPANHIKNWMLRTSLIIRPDNPTFVSRQNRQNCNSPSNNCKYVLLPTICTRHPFNFTTKFLKPNFYSCLKKQRF